MRLMSDGDYIDTPKSGAKITITIENEYYVQTLYFDDTRQIDTNVDYSPIGAIFPVGAVHLNSPDVEKFTLSFIPLRNVETRMWMETTTARKGKTDGQN